MRLHRRVGPHTLVIRKRRRFKTFEKPLPGIIGRPSGMQMSDPDFWKERAEAEAAANEPELPPAA